MQVGARPAERDLQHRVRPAIVVSAGSSSRRQISGLTPRTTTRSWYRLGRGAGCMVSGMAPILAPRTDGPGQGASHGLSRSRSTPTTTSS